MSFFQFGSIVERLTNVTAAGGTTTLVNTSTQIQVLTTSGSNGQVFQLPDATTMVNGMWFEFYNESAGLLTINNSSSTTLYTVSPGLSIMVKLTNNGTAAGIWASLAATAASSGGSKNYLTSYTPSLSGGVANPGNGNFENSTTSGWSLAHSSLSSFIPTSVASGGNPFSSSSGGSAASGNLSLSIVSSSQLSGSYSASLASTAASTAGDMIISNAFYIDLEDQAKMMTVQFRYKAVSGTFNFSGTTANSFAIWIYDCTNNAWIMPAGVYGMVQGTGVGYATNVTFQTTANSTRYQLALVNINATSGAYTLYLDDFIVGPQTAPSGPAMTDWQTYTPTYTSFGSVATTVAQWKRVGDSLVLRHQFTGGTAVASIASVSLPAGFTANTNGSNQIVGQYWLQASTTQQTFGGAIMVMNATPTVVEFGSVSVSTTVNSSAEFTPQNGTNVLANSGIVIGFDAVIPIVGWSSNTSQSSDTDTRVVAASAHVSSGVSTTGGNPVNFDTVDYDTHGGITTGVTTWKYTCPVSGFYEVFLSSYAGATSVRFDLYKNGSIYRTFAFSTNSGAQASGATQVQCVAGDTLNVIPSGTYTPNGGSTTVAAQNWVAIKRLCGPAVIAATEVVACYGVLQTPSGTISTSASNITKFGTVTKDTHGAYNTSTGLWTCPVSGWYHFSAGIFVNGSFLINNYVQAGLYQNSSQVAYNAAIAGGSQSSLSCSLSQDLYCNAGDTVGITTQSSATSPSFATNSSCFSIARTGRGN